MSQASKDNDEVAAKNENSPEEEVIKLPSLGIANNCKDDPVVMPPPEPKPTAKEQELIDSSLQNQDSFFGAAGYSSSESSDFSSDDDSYFDGPTKGAASVKVGTLESIEAQNFDQDDLSESEDDSDEMTQMLMKSSTKHFNHVNCQQSRIHTPFLCQARPEGQSLMTKEQSKLIRKKGAISRISKSRKLEKQLHKDLSTMSNRNVVAAKGGSFRGPGFIKSLQESKLPGRSERRLTAKMTKSRSNHAKSLKGKGSQRTIQTFRNKHSSYFGPHDVDVEDLGILSNQRIQSMRERDLGTIPESLIEGRHSTPKTPVLRKSIVIPDYVWYYIMVHLDLPFILTRLMTMSSEKREFFKSLNSALFDSFLRTYGLFVKLRRTELAGTIELVPFLTKLESNMVRAYREKALADEAYQQLITKQRMKKNETAKAKRKSFGGKQMMSQQFLARPPEADDLIYEFDQSQFVAGKQLQVFPFVTDGGFQSSSKNTNTMFELFNSKYTGDFAHRNRGRRGRGGGFYGRGGYGGGYDQFGHNSNSDQEFRQYISQRLNNVSVACYIGRDCAIQDYSNFSVNKIYRKEAMVTAPPHFANAKSGEGAAPTQVSVKLRGVNCDQYFTKPSEKETYKVLHQLEFYSFREEALLSAKMCAQAQSSYMYDDYYEYDQPHTTPSVFESNQKSMIVFLVNSHSSIQRSEQFQVLDAAILPDIKAFQDLGFPLKQTVKVHQTTRQSLITKQKKPGDASPSLGGQPQLSASQSLSKLFSFHTLPLMESAVGAQQAKAMLEQIVAEEEGGQDVGCICEIDLSQRKKICKIMSKLLYPPKQAKNAATQQQENKATTEPPAAEESKGIDMMPFSMPIQEIPEMPEMKQQVQQQQMIVTTGEAAETENIQEEKKHVDVTEDGDQEEQNQKDGAGQVKALTQSNEQPPDKETESHQASQSQQLQQAAGAATATTATGQPAQKSVPYLDVMPLLYIKNHSKGQVLERWALRFQQKVGAKYLIIKTLNSLGATENQHSNKTKDGLHHGQFVLYGEKMPSEF